MPFGTTSHFAAHAAVEGAEPGPGRRAHGDQPGRVGERAAVLGRQQHALGERVLAGAGDGQHVVHDEHRRAARCAGRGACSRSRPRRRPRRTRARRGAGPRARARSGRRAAATIVAARRGPASSVTVGDAACRRGDDELDVVAPTAGGEHLADVAADPARVVDGVGEDADAQWRRAGIGGVIGRLRCDRGLVAYGVLRVLMVSSLWPPEVLGGAELYAAALAARLRRAGHTVAALTAGVDGDDVVAQIRPWGYPLHGVRASSPARSASCSTPATSRSPDAGRDGRPRARRVPSRRRAQPRGAGHERRRAHARRTARRRARAHAARLLAAVSAQHDGDRATARACTDAVPLVSRDLGRPQRAARPPSARRRARGVGGGGAPARGGTPVDARPDPRALQPGRAGAGAASGRAAGRAADVRLPRSGRAR